MTLVFYLLFINAVTYLLYWADKRAAVRGGWRIPEASLLLAGFLGGTLAAILAQQRLRHKTKKFSFQAKFFLLTIVQVGVILFAPERIERLISALPV